MWPLEKIYLNQGFWMWIFYITFALSFLCNINFHMIMKIAITCFMKLAALRLGDISLLWLSFWFNLLCEVKNWNIGKIINSYLSHRIIDSFLRILKWKIIRPFVSYEEPKARDFKPHLKYMIFILVFVEIL